MVTGALWALRPLGVALVGSAASVPLVAAAVPGPGVPPFLLHVLVLAVGAGAAYLLDDPALEATQVTPRARARRLTLVVPLGLSSVGLAWVAVAAVAKRWTPELSSATLAAELFGVALLALTASAVLLRRGDACPGNRVAAAVGLGALAELVGQPGRSALELLPDTASLPTAAGWGSLLAGAVVVFAFASRDVAAPPVLSRRPRALPARPG
jgi:hypothetical protein